MRCLTVLPLAAIAGAGAAQPANVRTDSAELVRRCVPAGMESRAMSELSAAQRQTMMSCAQGEAARQLNAQTPIQVDELSAVRSVTAEGAQLTYHMQVQVNLADVTDAQRAGVVQSTRGNVCGLEQMRRTMAMGGSYRYIWTDRTGAEIARTVIAGC